MQERLSNTAPFQVKSAKALRTEIFKCLNTAQDEGRLRTELYQIHKLLKITPPSKGIIEITGGERNFHRDKTIPHFEIIDGCWFDFAILVDENYKPAEIIGFTCEIRFLDEKPIQFLRFDLNLPEHNNEGREMRFHLHPGSDDFMVPSPPMSPLEIIHLFLYGLDTPQRPRSS
ncbi:hypothetical protein [Nostoc sp. MS1]|uniref:hypothetical protein n=1 Tax=Nostoc sp. MS1 TaxID=2764711 RepID=UPI001CC74A62|nr:hypothetical protein [Nostoc sp. MS1]BCL34277.1 hypothetical protein NSMS1_07240 [Nostoc sp. MS1]